MHDLQEGGVVDAWDKSVPAEANAYYWTADPVVRAGVTSNPDQPVVAELFCGLGGLSQGFIQAGCHLTLVADIHEPSIESMGVNHPEATAILGDLKKVPSRQLKAALNGAQPDIMMAGVPCQGFSRSNRKRNDEDERNQLFRDFLRLSKSVRPRAVLIENVSGMRSAKGGDFVRDIADAIETELSLEVHLAFLNAAHFGVPQTRERLFFVGLPKGASWLAPKATHGPGTGQPMRTVRDAIEDLPPLAAGQSTDKYRNHELSEYAALMRRQQQVLLNHRAPNHPQETIDRIKSTKPGQPMYASFKQRIRLSWDQPSPTQVSGGIRAQFQFGHPSQARGLTIRERCRIQSFPDTIHVEGGLVQGRVQTGNAVPPLLAQAVAESMLRAMNIT
jgi:DNA (cytosine-5)-methyltransferase 1